MHFAHPILESDPTGPLVVIGPEGSGKSSIVRQVLCTRENVLYQFLIGVSCKSVSIQNDNESTHRGSM